MENKGLLLIMRFFAGKDDSFLAQRKSITISVPHTSVAGKDMLHRLDAES
jgi:hypothetical protein